MLTIFNRRELTVVFDMKRQAEVRDLLAQNGIGYSVIVINRKSPSPFSAGSRGSTRTFDLQLDYEYIIYVHKSDYSRALAIISGKDN